MDAGLYRLHVHAASRPRLDLGFRCGSAPCTGHPQRLGYPLFECGGGCREREIDGFCRCRHSAGRYRRSDGHAGGGAGTVEPAQPDGIGGAEYEWWPGRVPDRFNEIFPAIAADRHSGHRCVAGYRRKPLSRWHDRGVHSDGPGPGACGSGGDDLAVGAECDRCVEAGAQSS